MNEASGALVSVFDDAFVVEGARTPFVDYNGAFSLVSPIELGIKAGRAALSRAGVSGEEIGAVGVPPPFMGVGPVPAIRAASARVGIAVSQIDRIEINEAFGAQVIACSRELGLDEAKLNVNGGAIAIGHPLGATEAPLALTVSRRLRREGLRYGVASACIGGGQGIAMILENPAAAI